MAPFGPLGDVVIYDQVRRLSDLTPQVLELVQRLGGVLAPRPFTYREIAERVLYRTEGVRMRPAHVRQALELVPGLLEMRAVAREARRPRVWPLDLRRNTLEARARALVFSKAAVLLEAEGGRLLPAYTLAELGRLIKPRPLGWQQVRRLLAGDPRGRELLAVRLEARMGRLWDSSRGNRPNVPARASQPATTL
jgi:hypothetical protein